MFFEKCYSNGNVVYAYFFQAVAPIGDDGDGHLAYKLGDVIEHEAQRCKNLFSLSHPMVHTF